MTAWGMLAIYYSDILNETLRACCARLFSLAPVCGFIALPKRRRTRTCFLALFAVVAFWWSSVKPLNNRGWQTDVAVLPYATMHSNLVTIHNIRTFNYRTATDFDARYYLYS
jgi:hypothetical protein